MPFRAYEYPESNSICCGYVAVFTRYCADRQRGRQQVCDVDADYALGVEDYPKAIRLHTQVVQMHPESALAHYHLGFAEGMAGNKTAELSEYRLAVALGLRNWDLFLNLGLAQLEDGDLAGATDNLRQAVLLGENHSESHFNLALAYERRGLFTDAEQETLTSLKLDPRQPDASNLLGVIYAQEGETVRASSVWRELTHEVPELRAGAQKSSVAGQCKRAFPWRDGGHQIRRDAKRKRVLIPQSNGDESRGSIS